jgi:hypothetical protein
MAGSEKSEEGKKPASKVFKVYACIAFFKIKFSL